MRLSTLLAALPEIVAQTGSADPEITRITADSRQVQPGTLFVATRGETVDAHRFIDAALAQGAAAYVAEAPPASASGAGARGVMVPDSRAALGWLAAAWHGFPSRRLVLIGVTGTDGKTTTATLIHAILLAAGLKAGLVSTVSAVIGADRLDTGFHVTTPDALEVQAYLARMVAAGLTHAVLEVTSHGLAQHRVTGCEFDVAVLTNITHEHLDYHKTYAEYRAAKARLFDLLAAAPPKPGGPPKAAVLNHDDSAFAYLQARLAVRTFTYAYQAAADLPPDSFWAEAVTHTPAGMQFSVGRRPAGPAPLLLHTPLVGAFNVSNCLAAVAATVGALDLAPAAAQQALGAFPGVPGRMERIDLGQPFTALVDFAHTPEALRCALETVRCLTTGRVVAVFGSAGLRDVAKRRLMAETAAQLADISLLTAEDPRTEALADILAMMANGAQARGGREVAPPFIIAGQAAPVFCRVPDRGEALRLAVRLAQPGDVVIACGKGHEQSMCFGTTEYPWDDRVALRAALAEWLNVPGPDMPRLPTAP